MAGKSESSTVTAHPLDAINTMQRWIWQAWSDDPDADTGMDPASMVTASMACAARNHVLWTRWWLDRLDGGETTATRKPQQADETFGQAFEGLSSQWLELHQRLASAWLDALTAHPAAGWTAPFALTRGMLDGWLEMQREWQDHDTWARLWQAGAIRRDLPEDEPSPEVEELEDMAKAAAVDARRQRRDRTSP